ncbi:hypothetical protein CIHG_06158 [Coccidioides immitis H538.4]|uniref:Uncharacterized protein n=1 Tax=Coccidioides immitis H538.4 TaxID=396776 RepID=A0A0J8RT18_COCIT|nr:hypothetical protein CIHG_06158 [Coccidioides immitis H538.4]
MVLFATLGVSPLPFCLDPVNEWCDVTGRTGQACSSRDIIGCDRIPTPNWLHPRCDFNPSASSSFHPFSIKFHGFFDYIYFLLDAIVWRSRSVSVVLAASLENPYRPSTCFRRTPQQAPIILHPQGPTGLYLSII